jgi:tetratricopeptide (TPR) repeat protein
MRLGLLLVFVGALSARAQSPAAASVLRAATNEYEILEFEKALDLLKAGLERLDAPNDRAHLHLFEGVLLSELRREPEAMEAFTRAFTQLPDLPLRVTVSPKVRAFAERARATVKLAALRAGPPTPEPPVDGHRATEPPGHTSAATEVNQPRAEMPSAPSAGPLVPVASAPSPSPPPSSTARRLWWIPGSVALLAGGAAVAFHLSARGQFNRLDSGSPSGVEPTLEEAQALVRDGKLHEAAGNVLLGVGAAGVLTAAGMVVFGRPTSSAGFSVVPSVHERGAFIAISGPLGASR